MPPACSYVHFQITGSNHPIHSLEDSSDGIGESEGGTISISQILSLKERFDRADTDGGGSLDLQEFMDAFGSIINKDGSMTGLFFSRIFDLLSSLILRRRAFPSAIHSEKLCLSRSCAFPAL